MRDFVGRKVVALIARYISSGSSCRNIVISVFRVGMDLVPCPLQLADRRRLRFAVLSMSSTPFTVLLLQRLLQDSFDEYITDGGILLTCGEVWVARCSGFALETCQRHHRHSCSIVAMGKGQSFIVAVLCT